jgi:hypothetical protein
MSITYVCITKSTLNDRRVQFTVFEGRGNTVNAFGKLGRQSYLLVSKFGAVSHEINCFVT